MLSLVLTAKMTAHRNTEKHLQFSIPGKQSSKGWKWQHSLPLAPTHKVCVRIRESTLPHTPYCLPPTQRFLFNQRYQGDQQPAFPVIYPVQTSNSKTWLGSRTTWDHLHFSKSRPRLGATNSQTHRISIFRSYLPTRWCQRTDSLGSISTAKAIQPGNMFRSQDLRSCQRSCLSQSIGSCYVLDMFVS